MYMYACTYVCTCMHVCKYVRMHAHNVLHMYLRMYIHMHAHIYICVLHCFETCNVPGSLIRPYGEPNGAGRCTVAHISVTNGPIFLMLFDLSQFVPN